MKNQLLFLLFLLPLVFQAQDNCTGSFTEYYLNSNNIRASFFPRGNKFTDGADGGFLVPYPSSERLSTIFASSPWIAGFDDAGNYKLAAERHPSPNDIDFSVGPLTTIGTPYDTVCKNFDRVWNVFMEDVTSHVADYYEDFKIDDTIPSIFGWPGIGNKYFTRFNGFELPPVDNKGLADFFDRNNNDLYDPDAGDYPVLNLEGHFYIPDQMLWMVFNDVNSNDTMGSGSYALRFEIQLTAFAFHCQDNTLLNNTIFNKYKIINRSVVPADSVFFGLWTDYDLGCSEDDFMGSDSARSTEFVYNADPIDGSNSSNYCSNDGGSYNQIPPVQSMTWLSHPMHSFIEYSHANGHVLEKYRLLNGRWPDDTPIYPEGDGYHPDSELNPTKFQYNGDPNDTSSWAAINVLDENWDHRSVSSVFLDRLDPGQVKIIQTAHMFHYNPDADHIGQLRSMYKNVDSLLAIMSLLPILDEPCTPLPICSDDDCVWPGDFDKNGIADHRDYLPWAALNGHQGPGRNGLVSWRGHLGENWNEVYEGADIKHIDGDGNGSINQADIDINSENHLLTNRYYTPEANYPVGSDIIITTNPTFTSQGSISHLSVRTGRTFENVLGITFTLEFDTALFTRATAIYNWPEEISRLIYYPASTNVNTFLDASFVQTNNLGIPLDSNISFIRMLSNSLRLRPGVSIPDSTVIRLRNLKAIDAEGNDLHIGSEPITIYKEGFVGIHDPSIVKTVVYPNPTNNFIHIETAFETEAQIFSLQGQLMKQFSVDEVRKPVDVSGFAPGFYILRILATGESIKIVVQ